MRQVLDHITEVGEHMIFSRNWFHENQMGDVAFKKMMAAIDEPVDVARYPRA